MNAEQIILVGGLWLDTPAWAQVTAALDGRAAPVALPAEVSATLADQAAAVVAAVDAAPGRPVVVGHSAASTLAWLAADARPEKVSKVALIGGWPQPGGKPYADFFAIENGVMAFPGWEPFEGPDAADLTPAAREAFAAAAVPVPGAVAQGVVRYADERRYDVPVALICPEFSPADARALLDAGDLPELARVKHLDLIDIDSGHWPMLTQPEALARILAGL